MPSVRLPAGLAGCIVVVGVLDAPIVFFAKLIIGRVGVRIPAQPELLDECFALLIIAEVLECFALFIGDDVGNFVLQPGLVGAFQLLPDSRLSSSSRPHRCAGA